MFYLYWRPHTLCIYVLLLFMFYFKRHFFSIVKEQIYTRTLKTRHNILLKRKTYLLGNFFFFFFLPSFLYGQAISVNLRVNVCISRAARLVSFPLYSARKTRKTDTPGNSGKLQKPVKTSKILI